MTDVEIATKLQVGLPTVRKALAPPPVARPRAARTPTERPRRRVAIIDGPSPVDVHVGRQVRLYRTVAGLSQTQLAEAIGLTFQQVQKYERGGNRISASKLVQIARVLGTPVTAFFEGLEPEAASPHDPGIMLRREAIELSRAYERIGSPDLRQSLMELFHRLGDKLTATAPRARKGAR
ncbi:MAG: helix-turn-helix transcriptional regulator [Alphaproteobacteria bacterium]|nr:helix-turn-helix transcriptional regulator [Alphaproteobacteria bacterium]